MSTDEELNVPDIKEVPLPAHTKPYTPPDSEIRPLAYKLYETWIAESKWSPGAVEPSAEFFWYEAENQIRAHHCL